jgi:hypothetical protein
MMGRLVLWLLIALVALWLIAQAFGLNLMDWLTIWLAS